MNNLIGFGNIDLIELLLIGILKLITSDTFLVIDKNSFSISWFNYSFDCFEDFIINESVIDISLKIMCFVWNYLIALSKEGDLSLVEGNEFLMLRQSDSGFDLSIIQFNMS